MREFEAVIFDADGTIINSQPIVHEAFRYTLLTHCDRDVSWEELSKILGIP